MQEGETRLTCERCGRIWASGQRLYMKTWLCGSAAVLQRLRCCLCPQWRFRHVLNTTLIIKNKMQCPEQTSGDTAIGFLSSHQPTNQISKLQTWQEKGGERRKKRRSSGLCNTIYLFNIGLFFMKVRSSRFVHQEMDNNNHKLLVKSPNDNHIMCWVCVCHINCIYLSPWIQDKRYFISLWTAHCICLWWQ